MSRRLLLIAILSVLLPVGVVAGQMDKDAPRPIVAALRAHPCVQRCLTRTERRMVAAQPVRGLYLMPARRPASLNPWLPDTRLPQRAVPRAVPLRAPPALA